ncbi:MAG: hypothetical protein WCX69_05175, partial [Candidatus Paceibacterota bacterium]
MEMKSILHFSYFGMVLSILAAVMFVAGGNILATTSCTYTYSSWGDCDSTSHQYRQVTSTYPSGVTCSNAAI